MPMPINENKGVKLSKLKHFSISKHFSVSLSKRIAILIFTVKR